MSTTDKNRRILIIDDNVAIHDDFRKILGAQPATAEAAAASDALADLEADLFGDEAAPTAVNATYEIDAASQGQEGFEMVQRAVARDERYALAFVDMRMPPGWDGMETIEHIWKVDPDLQVVICSAYSEYSWEDIVKKFGMHDRLLILKKPFDTAEVCQLACALTEKWQLARHAHLKLAQLESMVNEHTRDLEIANQRLQVEIAERQRSEDRYRLAAVGANDGLWDWDLVEGRVYYAPRWKAILGYEEHEIGDRIDAWLDLVHADDRGSFRDALDAFVRDGDPQLRHEHRMLHKDGSARWLLCRGTAVRDAEGRRIRAAGSISDITDRKLAEEQLRFDAHHDPLTGLANRALLVERLDAVLRRKEHSFALLFMDMDRFKVINDSLGHVVGDKLLQGLASRLRDATRCLRLDPKPEGCDRVLLARIGGDEFVVLCDALSDRDEAAAIADRVHATLAEPFRIDGHEVVARVSIGVTMCAAGYERGEDVMRDADTAMYQAKSEGRGRTRFFDTVMRAGAMERFRVETELRRAIERDELVLHYQPICDANGRVTSVEALVRWAHPTRGLVPPSEFSAVAEETGLIVPLGRTVLRAACLEVARWQRELAITAPYDDPIAVAVNVSARQFTEPGFGDVVREAIESSGLPARSLILEITESTAMSKIEGTLARIASLRARGVRFYLDDFGTGYSSLSYLHRMPICALKIDPTFVAQMESDATSRSIVQAIIALAHALSMRVVAESVETKGAFEALRNMGCDGFQGHWFGAPMPAAAAAARIAPEPLRRAANG